MSEVLRAALAAANDRLDKARGAADVYLPNSGLTGVVAHLLVGAAELALAVIVDELTEEDAAS